MDQRACGTILRYAQLLVGILGMTVSAWGLIGVFQFISTVTNQVKFTEQGIRELSTELQNECKAGRLSIEEAMAPVVSLLQKRTKDLRDSPRIVGALLVCMAGVSLVSLTAVIFQSADGQGHRNKGR